LFAGCVRQVVPFYSYAVRFFVLRQLWNWGIFLEFRAVCAARCAGCNSASGGTLWERSWVCQ
jgi:hypothetical protein